MLITLIITTHKGSQALACILKTLLLTTDRSFEIIVAEDGQDPLVASVVQAFLSHLPIQHISQEHLGMRKSRILNSALRIAAGDYIIFLDGDCVPHPKFLDDHRTLAKQGYFVQGRRAFIKESAVTSFMHQPSTGYFLKLWCSGNATGFFKGFRIPFAYIKTDTRLKGILGCNFAAWKADVYAINGFDAAFEGWGKEDSDLARRLYIIGLKRRFVYAHCIVYHLNHPKQTINIQNDYLFESKKDQTIAKCKQGIYFDT